MLSIRTARTFLLLLAVGAACKGTPEVGLSMSVPRDLIGQTAWFEVAAYKDAHCAAVTPMLRAGVPDGANARVAFTGDDKTPPAFGNIPTGHYAFGGVARDKDCAVIAAGCDEADVGDVDVVSLALAAVDPPTGKCEDGSTCQAARCVPPNDNANPSVGAGCSLELLGSGPLANPVGGIGTVVSAPAIASTASGFIIAYREIDPNGAGARITLLPVDTSGGALPAFRPALPEPCANSDETDGVGLVVNGDAALLALAKAPCGTKPELQLLNFNAAASPPAVNKFVVSPSPNDVRVSLGAGKPSATRPGGSLVVFTEGGVARIASMDPEKGIIGPNGSFGGSGVTDAWIAANEKVLALLAVGPGTVVVKPVTDAGADSGVVPDPDQADAGPAGTLRLVVLASNTDVQTIDATKNAPKPPIVFPGVWGSIAAIGGRVVVMSDGDGPGRSVTYRAFDLDKDTASDSNGFSIEGQDPVTAGDVALLGDRAFFASLKVGEIALHVFDHATTTLTPLHDTVFTKEPRISGINTVRDGRISVAATDTRVAVAWTTTKKLGLNDTTGGYAVFGCTK